MKLKSLLLEEGKLRDEVPSDIHPWVDTLSPFALDYDVEYDDNSPIPNIDVMVDDKKLITQINSVVKKIMIHQVNYELNKTDFYKNITKNKLLFQYKIKIIQKASEFIIPVSRGPTAVSHLQKLSPKNNIKFFAHMHGANLKMVPIKQPEILKEILNRYQDDPDRVKYINANSLMNIIREKIIFSNNKTTLSKFTASFDAMLNKLFDTLQIDKNRREELHKVFDIYFRYDFNADSIMQGTRDAILNLVGNSKVLKSPLYFIISDKAHAKLNIAVSKFYTSCQNLYTGSYRGQLLDTVLDKNTKVGYFVINEKFTDNKGIRHTYTPVIRVLLRNNKEGKVFLDDFYPSSINNTKLEADLVNFIKKYVNIEHPEEGHVHISSGPHGINVGYSDRFEVGRE
jgi:hypothetical protein